MSKRILVVDDDAMHLQTTREILELEGFEVAVHNSPFGTTEVVKNVRPQLVLLDINMPGLSGDRLCALLRGNEHGRSVPILFYSSNDEETLRASVRKHEASGYVCKGDIAGLRRTVRQLTERAA